MELALTTIDSLFEQAEKGKENNELIKMAFDRLENYIRLGLKNGIENAKRGILSAIVNSNNLRLIEVEPWGHYQSSFDMYHIRNIDIDGSAKIIDGTWKFQMFDQYAENKNHTAIPLEALNKISLDMKNKLGVFYQAKVDPILVYILKFNPHYYIDYVGIFDKEVKIPTNYYPGKNSMFVALRQWD